MGQPPSAVASTPQAPVSTRDLARAFLRWAERSPLPRNVAWRAWADARRLSGEDLVAVQREVRNERIRRIVENFKPRQSGAM